MTSACVARNVSSELKTCTKNAGSRSPTVSRSNAAKSRHVLADPNRDPRVVA